MHLLNELSLEIYSKKKLRIILIKNEMKESK